MSATTRKIIFMMWTGDYDAPVAEDRLWDGQALCNELLNDERCPRVAKANLRLWLEQSVAVNASLIRRREEADQAQLRASREARERRMRAIGELTRLAVTDPADVALEALGTPAPVLEPPPPRGDCGINDCSLCASRRGSDGSVVRPVLGSLMLAAATAAPPEAPRTTPYRRRNAQRVDVHTRPAGVSTPFFPPDLTVHAPRGSSGRIRL